MPSSEDDDQADELRVRVPPPHRTGVDLSSTRIAIRGGAKEARVTRSTIAQSAVS